MAPRTVVIGLDGADLNLFDAASKGDLPNLAALMRAGAWGSMKTTIPWITPTAWASFMTGTDPGKHGVLNFTLRDGYTDRVCTSRSVRASPFWKFLKGKKMILVNIPLTYPTDPVDGVMVSGVLTPPGAPDFAYPPQLSKELWKMGYRAGYIKAGKQRRELEELFQQEEDRGRVVLHLMEKYPWDVLVAIFEAHLHFHGWEDILEMYKRLDRVVGDLVQKAGEDTNFIVMSDHGCGPLRKDFCINSWLMATGRLKPTEVPQGSLSSVLRRLGVTREGVLRRLSSMHLLFLRRLAPRFLRRATPRIYGLDIDWTQTQAFALVGDGIVLNIRGREPKGIVEPKAVESLRSEIIRGLLAVTDPDTGEAVITLAVPREEIYQGPHVKLAPDIVIEPRVGYHLRIWSRTGAFLESPSEDNYHTPTAIILLKGPDIQNIGRFEGANILDIAPTLLHLMDVPVPPEMDGRVLDVALRKKADELARPSTPDSEQEAFRLSPEDEEKVKERLRRLGYLT